MGWWFHYDCVYEFGDACLHIVFVLNVKLKTKANSIQQQYETNKI